jgi:hypothetical protein
MYVRVHVHPVPTKKYYLLAGTCTCTQSDTRWGCCAGKLSMAPRGNTGRNGLEQLEDRVTHWHSNCRHQPSYHAPGWAVRRAAGAKFKSRSASFASLPPTHSVGVQALQVTATSTRKYLHKYLSTTWTQVAVIPHRESSDLLPVRRRLYIYASCSIYPPRCRAGRLLCNRIIRHYREQR